MRRTLISAAIMCTFMVVVGGGVATAQYPPGTTSPTTAAPGPQTGGVINAGTHAVGETFTVEQCGFGQQTTVTITVNGQTVGTKTADANGCVRASIHVLSFTAADVNDPVRVAIRCGLNNIVATGRTSAGVSFEQTSNFTVSCAAATRPARTGANVLRWSGIGVALVLVGFLVVAAVRRRGGSPAS